MEQGKLYSSNYNSMQVSRNTQENRSPAGNKGNQCFLREDNRFATVGNAAWVNR